VRERLVMREAVVARDRLKDGGSARNHAREIGNCASALSSSEVTGHQGEEKVETDWEGFLKTVGGERKRWTT